MDVRSAWQPILGVFVLTAVLGACGGNAGRPPDEGARARSGDSVITPSHSSDTTLIAGLIAIGHSGLTGENADPDRPGAIAAEYSWATGTSPDVQSIYQRMVEALPETQDRVFNAARGGAVVTDLPAQANTALAAVPAPKLPIIRTIDGDIRCDGTDDENVAEFGEAIRQTLEIITEKSPESRILVTGQPGRPTGEAEMLADLPEVRRMFGGTGMCDMFDAQGNLVQERLDALTAILEKYEAEQERVCADVPQCATDRGAMAAFPRSREQVSDDWNHLSTAGHAALAEQVWSAVADLLDLP